jgi:hypothetical protein
MTLVAPGRLDVRVLGQGTFWVNREGVVLRLDAMSGAHLAAVAAMLGRQATKLHFWALVEAVYAVRESARSGVPCGDELEFALTGASIADATAGDYVAASPLMRAIAGLLAGPA